MKTVTPKGEEVCLTFNKGGVEALLYLRPGQQQLHKSKSWIHFVIISCQYFAKKSIQIVRIVTYFYVQL